MRKVKDDPFIQHITDNANIEEYRLVLSELEKLNLRINEEMEDTEKLHIQFKDF